jgi:DNA-binding NarL/FixJ family response regulator
MSANPDLTPWEQDVLALLTMGKTNREIAAELNVTESSVKSHLSSIYRTLGVSNRTEAALVGLRILPPMAS